MWSTDRGIFLHRSHYSSSSLIVSFYTQKRGLQKFLFKGGKKKAHNLYPLAISELTFYGKKNSDLMNLTSADSSFSSSLSLNPKKGTIAFFMAETILKSVKAEDADAHLFSFIEEQVKELHKTDRMSFFPLDFLIGLSSILGFNPLVENDDAQWFNLDAGTVKQVPSKGIREYSNQGVGLILSRMKKEELEADKTDKSVRESALEIMLEYYRIHVPKFGELESYDIIKEVLHA